MSIKYFVVWIQHGDVVLALSLLWVTEFQKEHFRQHVYWADGLLNYNALLNYPIDQLVAVALTVLLLGF